MAIEVASVKEDSRARDVAKLGEPLPSIHKSLGFVSLRHTNQICDGPRLSSQHVAK